MIFRTEGSTYEVNFDQKQIRRLHGKKAPTARQGEDGTWKTYRDITPIKVGSGVLVTWSIDSDDGLPTFRTTQMSPVVEIDVKPAN